VAEWGVQAAEALDHAHQLGIVHRDVKPANLMLDGSGRLWVTDFGLAQVQSDTRLTMTGDLVGTLRYMSPEQALAQRVVVDHRTDVYSLGATLYELLTLRPVFEGQDRQELLRQIAFEEPPRPRKLDRAIPAELEIIVLKALEKRPQDRYATAQLLADDLRRWQEDRPIQARRPGLYQRAAKWLRRHRAVAAWAGVFLLVALAALACSTVIVALALAKETEAKKQEEAAKNQEKEAKNDLAGANTELTKQTQLAQDALEKKEDESYSQCILLAKYELADGRVQQADELLERCPEERRRWEWYYLKRLYHSERATLKTGQAYQLAFSPDGRQLVSWSSAGVKLWDVATGRALLTLPLKRSVIAVRFNGKHLATLALDFKPDDPKQYGPSLAVWDAVTGEKVSDHFLCAGSLWSVAFSPDGNRVAVAGFWYAPVNAVNCVVWNVTTGTRELELERSGGGNGIGVTWSPDDQGWSSMTWGPDGRHIATGVALWAASTGKKIISFPQLLSSNRLVFSPDGRRLAGFTPKAELTVWDAATGQELLKLSGRAKRISAMAFSPDGKRLACAEGGGRDIRVWNAATGQELSTLRGHSREVTSITFSPDNQHLASASVDGTVKIWDTTAVPGCTVRHTAPNCAGLTSTGRVVSVYGDRLKVTDLQSGKEILSVACAAPNGSFRDPALSDDGNRLAANLWSSDFWEDLKVWDLSTRKEVFSLQSVASKVKYLLSSRLSPDGQRLTVVDFVGQGLPSPAGALVGSAGYRATWQYKVKVWDVATGQESHSFPVPLGMSCSLLDWKRVVCFPPPGPAPKPALVVGQVFDITTGRELGSFSTAYDPHERRFISPDRKWVACSHVDEETGNQGFALWDITTGEKLFSASSPFHDLAFSPDGRRLAVLGPLSNPGTGRLTLRELPSGRPLFTLDTPSCYRVQFSPDGKRLMTATVDGTVLIWGAALAGADALAPAHHDAQLNLASFLLSCPPGLRDRERALHLTREAEKQLPDTRDSLRLLAEVYSQAEDWPAAARALERYKPLGMFQFNEPELFFRLAVAHARAGDARRARRHYDEGVARWRPFYLLKEHEKEDPGTTLYRQYKAIHVLPVWAEAAALLGLQGDSVNAHATFAFHLRTMGCLDEAIAESQQAVALAPNNAGVRVALGIALAGKRQLDEAIAEYNKAFAKGRLDVETFALARVHLGLALEDQGRLDEAIAEYKKVLAIDPDHAAALCFLGDALFDQGRFDDALPVLRRGHELRAKPGDWPYRAPRRSVQLCETFRELDRKLPALLDGQQPLGKDPRWKDLAELCRLPGKARYRDAVRIYAEGLAAHPELKELSNWRYDAACAAVLAAAGQGVDADKLSDRERASLRQRALNWLRADVKVYQDRYQRMMDLPPAERGKERPTILNPLQVWLGDSSLADVRGAEALARLSDPEREGWQGLWEEVEVLLQRIRQSQSPPGFLEP
jgi:WD40 repeat protein/tetratricopeptide (TPR) repeat protein